MKFIVLVSLYLAFIGVEVSFAQTKIVRQVFINQNDPDNVLASGLYPTLIECQNQVPIQMEAFSRNMKTTENFADCIYRDGLQPTSYTMRIQGLWERNQNEKPRRFQHLEISSLHNRRQIVIEWLKQNQNFYDIEITSYTRTGVLMYSPLKYILESFDLNFRNYEDCLKQLEKLKALFDQKYNTSVLTCDSVKYVQDLGVQDYLDQPSTSFDLYSLNAYAIGLTRALSNMDNNRPSFGSFDECLNYITFFDNLGSEAKNWFCSYEQSGNGRFEYKIKEAIFRF